ncbi:MAG: YdjY domain-containing protein [Deferrisomatales bacterium]|nr:YdjY domain-containing protein [Deferrisomatales bacterium]
MTRHRNHGFLPLLVCLVSGLWAPWSRAAPSPLPEGAAVLETPKAAAEAVIDPNTGGVRIGGVEIDPVAREVRFRGLVNMNEGLLEYALVGGQGKLHESLLRTEVAPYDLHVALLLLGLKGGGNLEFQGDPRPPEGDPVRVSVGWQGPQGTTTVRLEELILNQSTGKAMPRMDWVFTGSKLLDGVFMAQVERSFVAIFRDPFALIDNPAPAGADDTVWFANHAACPPPGTEVDIVIRPAAK